MTMLQAWKVYCREMKKSGSSKKNILQLRMFKMKASSDMLKSGRVMKSKRGSPSASVDILYNVKKNQGPTTPIPEPSTRTDNVGHFQIFSEKKCRCKYLGCTEISKVLC